MLLTSYYLRSFGARKRWEEGAMKDRSQHILRNLCFFVFVSLSGFSLLGTAGAQTTAFNYQGSLKDGGNPANGSFQMQFKLFDSLAGAGQIGSTITDVPVTVTAGVFGVKLDFGSNALSGANRWLEIAVRHNSGESYTTLSPREQIASSPYSVRTLSAASADGLSASCVGCVQDANINSVAGAKITGTVANATSATNATNATIATNATNSAQLGGVNASEYVTITTNSFIRNQETLQPTSNFNITGNGLIGGNLGVGTTSPVTRLALNGGPGWTSNGWIGSLSMQNGSAIGWAGNSGGQRFGIGQTNGGLYFFRTASDPGTTGSPAIYELVITDSGNISQARDKGGLAKAMIAVNINGTILRCYNGQTGSSAGNCGFIISHPGAGGYRIDFGFQINDRFSIATPEHAGEVAIIPESTNILQVSTTLNNTPFNSGFVIIVF